MITIKAQAKGTGRVVNWARFKKGELVDQSRLGLSLTVVIPDVITDVISRCQELTDRIKIEPLFPNGFTKTSFDITIDGGSFHVNCGRRLVRGLFPLNPIAAEFGSNYDVLLNISAEKREIEEDIASAIRGKYMCQEKSNSEHRHSR